MHFHSHELLFEFGVCQTSITHLIPRISMSCHSSAYFPRKLCIGVVLGEELTLIPIISCTKELFFNGQSIVAQRLAIADFNRFVSFDWRYGRRRSSHENFHIIFNATGATLWSVMLKRKTGGQYTQLDLDVTGGRESKTDHLKGIRPGLASIHGMRDLAT